MLASQVDHLVLRHCNTDITPQVFIVKPKMYSFKAFLPSPACIRMNSNDKQKLAMKARQLPVVVNHATTGHKLQGSTVKELFIHAWSTTQNWNYVVLSRVKTLSGLYCRKKLSINNLHIYQIPEKLKRMLRNLRLHAPTRWSEDEYETHFFR